MTVLEAYINKTQQIATQVQWIMGEIQTPQNIETLRQLERQVREEHALMQTLRLEYAAYQKFMLHVGLNPTTGMAMPLDTFPNKVD